MKKLILILCLLLPVSSASAEELLIVKENSKFDESLKSFTAVFSGETRTLYTRNLSRADIVVRIKRAKPPLILAAGPEALTKADQASIPIVYIGVENTAPYEGRDNITGISTRIPPAEQLKVFLRAIPSIKRVGIVHSALSGLFVEEARGVEGVELVDVEACNPRHAVPAITDVFESGIDAYWVVSDLGVYYPEMHNYLYRLSFQNRIPLLTTIPKFRKEAAVVSLEADLDEMGKQAGAMVNEILRGKWMKPEIAAYNTRVNRLVAGKMGISFEKEWLVELMPHGPQSDTSVEH